MIQYKGYVAEDSVLSSIGGGAMTCTLFSFSLMPPIYADSIKSELQMRARATASEENVCRTSSGKELKNFFMGEYLILFNG